MSTVNKPDLRLTYKEYVLFPDDGNRHEIINGDHYMTSAPSTYHQTVSKRLQFELYTKIELAGHGQVFNAPIDVQFSLYDVVQPDLVAMFANTRAKITPAKIIGPPDIVVEIMSPSTASNDLELKRRLYERNGVGEYWIVDPHDNSIRRLVLQDGVYVDQPVEANELRLVGLPEVTICCASIW